VNLEAIGGSSPGAVSDGVTLEEVTTDFSSGDEQFGPGDTIQITDTVVTGGGPLQSGSANADRLVIELVWAPGGGDAQSVFSDDELRNVDTSVVPNWSP
jgi:hypothetical protein